jgi:hypothetical protein
VARVRTKVIFSLVVVVVGVVVVVAVALLNYGEFRHGCTSSRLLRISSWLQVDLNSLQCYSKSFKLIIILYKNYF